MKFAVALGLLAVALAAPNWETRPELVRDQKFQPGKQYNFKYDGQIATGVPVPSASQNSASRIESLVSLVMESDRHAVLRINKIRVGSAQRENVESRDVQPFGIFEETELTKEQKENLGLPVRFRFESGLVSEIEFDREEPTWSANIKRAILNMLQMNLSKKSRSDNLENSRLRIESEDEEEKNFFTAHEQTLEGDCQTSYTIVPAGEEKLRVSKSINFERCTKRVDIRYNLRFGEECPSCESKYTREEPNTQSSTVLEFELNGTPSEYLIREVRLRSQYVFTPLSGEEQIMGTYVNNKLTLLSVESGAETPRGPKSEKKESLVYSTEWEQRLEKFRMTGDESLLEKTPYLWIEKKMDMAEKSIDNLKKHFESAERKEEMNPESVHEMARLIEVLRVMTIQEIEKIEKLVNKSEDLEALFFDALAQAGTQPCIARLIEGITSRRLSTVQTIKALKMILNVRYPSEKMVNELVRLSKETVARNPVVRQSLWLSIGAVMNGVCGENRERFALNFNGEKDLEMCPRELKKEFVRVLETLYKDAESQYEKILALKVYANAGIDMCVLPIEKIIRDVREPKSVRLTAVEALRKLRTVMPRKVQSILLPLYKNKGESVELRVAAFHHLMHTMPARSIIDQITLQLENEPSTRLFSFVLSTLESLARSELPCEKDLARDIAHSLKLVRRQSAGLFDSRTVRASYYSHEYMSGAALSWSHLFSNESMIPSEISASLDTIFGGEWYSHMAEIGFSQENMHILINKFYQIVKDNEDSIEKIMVRGKRSAERKPLELLKDLMKTMGIQERRSSSKDSAAVVYMRVKDMDYVFLPLEEKIISEAVKMFVKNGDKEMEQIEKVLARGYTISGVVGSFVYEKTRVIPTTIGMPLEMTWKMPSILSLNAHVKASIENKSINLAVSPKLASTHIVHFETRSPILSHGVKIIRSLTLHTPVDAELKYESGSRSIVALKLRVPENESTRVLRILSRPVTYIRHENNKKSYGVPVEKTVYLVNQPRQEISRVYGEEILGLRFAVSGEVHRRMVENLQNGEAPLFVGENEVEIRMEKTDESPKEYTFRLAFDSIEKKNKMTEDVELDAFYPKEHTHFNVHGEEKMEKSRRSELNEYIRTLRASPVYNHRVHLTVETLGSPVERNAKGELRTMCDESLSYCKWRVIVSRSPLLKGENKEWELDTTLQTLVPSRMRSVADLKEQKYREVLALLTSKWGSSEEQQKKMEVRVQMDQSPEHIKMIERLMEKKSIESVHQATRLNQIKISADYSLPRETVTQFSRLSTLLKALYPFSIEIESRENQEESIKRDGRLLAKMTVEPQTWRYANISVETPREMLTLSSIRLPVRPTWFSLAKKEESMLRALSPVCKISSSRMETFDEIIYRAPLTTCYSVLAKDCSEEPNFAVLLKKIGKNGEEKKMKIITRDYKFEIKLNKQEIGVTVDGKIVKENKMNEYGLEKHGDYIIFENEDIFVKFDGYKAEIKMNHEYKNKQCGLCGHFDGEKNGEFRMANNEETEDIEEFHRSFLVKNEECEIEEQRLKEKKHYKKIESSSESDSEENDYENEKKEKRESNYDDEDEDKENDVEPEEKTRVKEYSHRLCFSKTPVPECPKNAFEKKTKDTKVSFTCLERSSTEARRLLRESRTQNLSLNHLPNTFVDTLSVPTMCNTY